MEKVELLAPAGSLAKLKYALVYGADAVYIGGEEFSSIKPKFRETVYGMIQRGEDAPSLVDQLGQVKEQYEEYFVEADPKPKNTPVFSKPGGSVQTNETEEDKLYAKLLEHWDK